MIRRTLSTVGVVAAVIAALVVTPTAYLPPEIPDREFSVFAAEQPVACPGRLELPVGSVEGESGEFGAGSDDVRYSEYSRDAEPVAHGTARSFDAPLATTIERVGGGDVAGLAALGCVEPGTDIWLLGGSTSVGNSTRLVIVNPTSAPSQVTVTLYGPAGVVSPQIFAALGPGAHRAFLVEGTAAEVATLAINVEASGSGVVAALQDSRLDGFIPAGTDWVAPSAPAATTVVVPAAGPRDAAAGSTATLRLFSAEDAEVELTLANELGEVAWPGAATVDLDAGTVVEIELPDVGAAAVVVEADVPVWAAVRTTVAREPVEGLEDDVARDLQWVQGQPVRTDRDLRAIVPHYDRSIAVYATESTVALVLNAETGEVIGERSLEAGTVARIPLTVSTGTQITVEGAVVWAVLVSGDPGFVTAVEPTDVTDDPAEIVVRPSPYVEGAP